MIVSYWNTFHQRVEPLEVVIYEFHNLFEVPPKVQYFDILAYHSKH